MRQLSVRHRLTRGLAFGLALWIASPASAQDRPRVVAVNQVLHEFAEHLLASAAEVVFPVPEGVDPSFWRPSIADISQIQSADLILLNGAGFATWIDRVSLPRSRVVNTSAKIEDQFIVTESITHSHGDGGEHSHEGLAAYTWLDPMLAIAQAEAIASASVARGLVSAEKIAPKRAALRAELTALDATAREALRNAQGVAMIATHPRYQYFGRRYALSITSLEWDAGAMPTEEELAELARFAEELDARVLIWEAEPPNGALQAAEELGLTNVVFAPGASTSSSGSFTDTFATAVADISNALQNDTD
ncbi:MAG: metal ABC transporter substrate-binding protein [Pseudomonadota bacterium]